jgi:RNA-binding protein
MLNGKQRSYLRSLANGIEPIIQIGKSDINENLLRQVDEALEARELVKIRILKNSTLDVEEAADELKEATASEIVQVIGKNFVLYRRAKEKPKIELP